MSTDQSPTSLSIGAVTRATGIAAETLRTWERRYGFPSPERTTGGHRLYPQETVSQLQLISRALAKGHRPRNIVGASRETLEALIGADLAPINARPEPTSEEPPSPPHQEHSGVLPPATQIERWLSAAREFDATQFERSFRRAWYIMGVVAFLENYAARFVRAVGDSWQAGTLSVGQEHFASERLRDFLTSQWRPLSDRSSGPVVICANLPGEEHTLGLHMAAVIMATSGCQVIFLGANTPLDEIAECAATSPGALAVMLSVSEASNPLTCRQDINELARSLPKECALVLGGAGAPHGLRGTKTIQNLTELSRWAPRLFVEHARR